jgi:hypothetical protein
VVHSGRALPPHISRREVADLARLSRVYSEDPRTFSMREYDSEALMLVEGL